MQNMKNLYFSQITHELRTPLASSIPILDNLKNYIHEERGQYLLKIIKNSTHHLANLVNDILDIARIENGKFEIHNEDFHLKRTIEEVIDILEF